MLLLKINLNKREIIYLIKKLKNFFFLNIFELILVNSMKDKAKVIKTTYK